jgi:hypothetical protein
MRFSENRIDPALFYSMGIYPVQEYRITLPGRKSLSGCPTHQTYHLHQPTTPATKLSHSRLPDSWAGRRVERVRAILRVVKNDDGQVAREYDRGMNNTADWADSV